SRGSKSEGAVRGGRAQVRGTSYVDRADPCPIALGVEGVPGRRQARSIVEDEGVAEPYTCQARISTQLNRCREAVPVIAGDRDKRCEGSSPTLPIAAGPAD